MNGEINLAKERQWKESQAHSSWQIFKIMAEFVDGFETLNKSFVFDGWLLKFGFV